jgi:hypothetical protein
MTNNKQQTAVEWQFEQLFNSFEKFNNDEYTFDEYLKRNLEIRAQAKEMENEDYLGKYSDGYLEGFNRALALVELTVEEYKDDIYYDRGLAKIHTRIKELKG